MVVVVPALAQCEHADDEVVLALVLHRIGLAAPEVADGVNAPGHMVHQEDADQSAPEEPEQRPLPTAHPEPAQGGRKYEARDYPDGKRGAHPAKHPALA